MYVLPEVLGRRILDSNNTTEALDALIHLSHLEISYATIAFGTYRREFAYFGQTVGNGQEMLKVARKSSSQSNTVATCDNALCGDVATFFAVLAATGREHGKDDSYTY
jgi:hypothetical protein